jgi:hypothetical protein
MHSLEKPIWDITGATWVDHSPNPRFAVWKTAHSPASDAVLDKETGLVWERSPSTDRMALQSAVLYSTTRVVAGRKGWRLPALEELLSLVDPSVTNPTLPAGNPFVNIQLDYFYWSLTRGLPASTNQNLAWGYDFGNADTSSIVISGATCYAWLVRGGYGHNYVFTV